MAQKDLEKFQTPATAFRGENGPGGPKTPQSGPCCGGFGTNGVCLWLKMRNFGFLGPGNHSGPLGKCFGRKNFFEKNVFLGHFGAFWGPNRPKWGVQGANFVVLGPENHLGCVFEQKNFFLKKKNFCPKMAQKDLEKIQTPAGGKKAPEAQKRLSPGHFVGDLGQMGLFVVKNA